MVRNITFRNSKQTCTGIPVIAANMDTVGTFEMAKALAKVGALLHLVYSLFSVLPLKSHPQQDTKAREHA